MKLSGKAWKFGADIDTDAIIPARYLNTSDPQELAKHCMEDADPEFAQNVSPGDIIVAERNFGCGSSREHAPIAIKAAGVSCVIATSFARIFYRNAINVGLPLLESDKIAADFSQEDQIELNMDKGILKDETTGKEYEVKKLPDFMLKILNNGGLIPYLRETLNIE